MQYFLSRDLGLDAVSNLDFMRRPGIYWKWEAAIFNGESFGSRVGPMHCFFIGGFHDFGHCIDFIMRGKASRITPTGLNFLRTWQTWNDVLNCPDGFPETAQATHNEARATAIQMFLMEKELGFMVNNLSRAEEDERRTQGLLAHLPARPQDDHGYTAHTVLEKVTAEGFAYEQRSLVNYPWDDMWNFLQWRGHDPHALECADMKDAWMDEYEKLVLEEYERLLNPFVERRISRAITELGARLRRFHARSQFTPTDEFIGQRPRRASFKHCVQALGG
ncbi:hypothetical protein ACI2KR_30485 [Pseudomonas luteola]